jgi:hypothetical protein
MSAACNCTILTSRHTQGTGTCKQPKCLGLMLYRRTREHLVLLITASENVTWPRFNGTIEDAPIFGSAHAHTLRFSFSSPRSTMSMSRIRCGWNKALLQLLPGQPRCYRCVKSIMQLLAESLEAHPSKKKGATILASVITKRTTVTASSWKSYPTIWSLRASSASY